MIKKYNKQLIFVNSESGELDPEQQKGIVTLCYEEDRGFYFETYSEEDRKEILEEIADSFRRKLVVPILNEDVFYQKYTKNDPRILKFSQEDLLYLPKISSI